MLLGQLQLIVNGVLLFILLVIVLIILRLGSRYDWSYGITEVQEPIRRQMAIMILIIIFIGIVAAGFNLFLAFTDV